MNSVNVTVTDAYSGSRLDRFLASMLPDYSRSRVQQLISQGHLTCNGKTVTDASRKVKLSEEYSLSEPTPVAMELTPLALALDIVYEDAHLLVVNKPVGLTGHPAAGNRDNTLVNALLAHCGESLSGIGGVARPGIVHRIDKDTSGLLVVAKTDEAHRNLAEQLATRTLKRVYSAFVWGAPSPRGGIVNALIARHPTKRKEMAIVEGGKHAITHYHTLESYGKLTTPLASKIECRLDTGRTHQIRVHMRSLRCPLIGDATYGITRTQMRTRILAANKETFPPVDEINSDLLQSLNRQALHAHRLQFYHPVTGEEIHCIAPLPYDLVMLENALLSLTK